MEAIPSEGLPRKAASKCLRYLHFVQRVHQLIVPALKDLISQTSAVPPVLLAVGDKFSQRNDPRCTV